MLKPHWEPQRVGFFALVINPRSRVRACAGVDSGGEVGLEWHCGPTWQGGSRDSCVFPYCVDRVWDGGQVQRKYFLHGQANFSSKQKRKEGLQPTPIKLASCLGHTNAEV